MGNLTTLLLPLESDSHGDLHGWPPSVDAFNSRPLFPGMGIDWLNNHMIQAIIGALLVVGLWLWFARKQTIVPSKRQLLGEMFYDLIRNSIARDTLGNEFKKYLPFLLTLFTFILVNNLFGEFFLFMFPTFSKIGYAYGLALLSFILYNAAGIQKYGLVHYFQKMTMPSGVPKVLYAIIIPLEFISNFVVRPMTLALRLFGNLFAGHIVVMVFVVGGSILLTWKDNLFYNFSGAVAILMSFAIFALEIFVAALQAYIFTVLTAQYVASSLEEAH